MASIFINDTTSTQRIRIVNDSLAGALTPPNVISLSRGIAAIALLFFAVFSMPFWILYCWGGVSDMIDGPIARKTKTVCELGARIDSISDLLFLVCSAIMVFPVISLPIWIWVWVAAIGAVKAMCIIFRSRRSRNPEVPHSMMNKLTGFLLFCLPFSVNTIGIFIPSIIVCIVASVSIVDDVLSIRVYERTNSQCPQQSRLRARP